MDVTNNNNAIDKLEAVLLAIEDDISDVEADHTDALSALSQVMNGKAEATTQEKNNHSVDVGLENSR